MTGVVYDFSGAAPADAIDGTEELLPDGDLDDLDEDPALVGLLRDVISSAVRDDAAGVKAADGFPPTDAMVAEAERGLAWRDEHGRGGTAIGVARARDIANRRALSRDTVMRMVSYFARHEVDKHGEGWSPGQPGYPSAGRIAWALWGGDAGRSWANAIAGRFDADEDGGR